MKRSIFIVKILFPLLAVLGGITIAIQGQINGGLGKKVGVIEASFISFGIGTLALLFIVLFAGNGNISAVTSVPKWQLIGGLLGAIYVIVIVLVVPQIGVAPTLVGVILGQILIGAVIDHFGLLGGVRIPLDAKKIAGICLLFVSLYLFNHK
nr:MULTISPECIES: DMT family transporter [unclassified Peribacillus]